MDPSHLKELEKIVGKENISEQPTDLLIYSYDSSQLKGTATAVIWPTTSEHVQKIIRYANKNNIPLTPRGGGTSLVGGAVPASSLIIDTSKMDKIIEETKNTITVESGMIVGDLNTYLKSKNLYFPVIPSSDGVATIGGMISTDAAGNRAIRYGKTSAWTEEIELVTGKGDTIKTKDIHEFAGTEGLLGIITKATLKLTHPPKQTSISTYEFDTPEEMIQIVKDHLKRTDIIAIEYIDPLTSTLEGGSEKYHLFIEYENAGGTYKTEKEIEGAWKLRKGLATVLSAAGYPLIEDPKIPTINIPLFLNWLRIEGIPNFGHIGYGIIHCRLKKDFDLKRFYTEVKNNNGIVSGEHGIGITKRQYIDETLKKSLQKKKQKYDPNNIMNRGKVI
ncbi:MAG: FAD-binding oxidoreductase [archaeon]